MSGSIRRIALNTGGGDAPGLNAVIRATVLSAMHQGWEVYGIRKGYGSLLDGEPLIEMDRETVRGITHLGGTILGTTNRGNPFEWRSEEHTSELQSRGHLVCRLLLEKKKKSIGSYACCHCTAKY